MNSMPTSVGIVWSTLVMTMNVRTRSAKDDGPKGETNLYALTFH
jgi:hypothetical protein